MIGTQKLTDIELNMIFPSDGSESQPSAKDKVVGVLLKQAEVYP